LFLILALWLALKIPAVQNWLGHKITDRIARELHTKVTVKRIGFSLFNKLNIEGLYIEDLNRDTLLYAGLAQVKITDWFFLKDKAVLSYVNLEDLIIHTNRKSDTWNYQFIIDRFGSNTNQKSTKGGIDLSLKQISISNLHLRQNDFWLGENQELDLQELKLNANEIDFKRKIVNITDLNIVGPDYKKWDFAKLKPSEIFAESTRKDSVSPSKNWNLFGWDIAIAQCKIKKGSVKLDKETGRSAFDYFDGQHLFFSDIDMQLKNINWKSDTVTFFASISAKEKSGLEIKQFNSKIKAYPNTIAFEDLLLKTPNSSISNRIAFSFEHFNYDINRFIHNININATFANSVVSAKDLALFSPALKKWDQDILLDGTISGTVDKFSSKNLQLQSGNTRLTGNLSLSGLPNIKETFIDFNNGNLTTGYNDLVHFLPALQNVKQIGLNKLTRINYDGNFTGFLNDFVTYGTLNTNLGTITTDINMKFPDIGLPGYSGKISTTQFQLGTLLKNEHLGAIGFNGKITGSGFELKDLTASINGETSRFQYDRYMYQHITINGRIEHKKFEGTILANDPHVNASLIGLIDLNKNIPVFDLTVDIKKSNLSELQLTKDNYSLTGLFTLNFSGNQIDNFDGSIRLKDAVLTKDNIPVSMDSLTLTSKKLAEGKELSIQSNDLNGFVRGKFTYRNIASAFEMFLYRYYPSIFNAPKKFDNNQNFVFELNANHIGDYLNFFGKKFKNFNEAKLEGSINTDLNEARFHAEIPQLLFSDKYKIDGLVLDGYGIMDSLVMTINCNKLSFNDSIDFYNTVLNVETIQKESVFRLQTVGDQAVNKLDFKGFMTVYDDGIQLNFNPSSFTINGNEWLLAKEGELILRKSVIAAENLKFTHSGQEIVIRSDPDDEGNHSNLIADVKNIEIGDFTPLFIKNMRFSGKLNGKIILNDPLKKPVISTKSYITEFWKDNDSLGRVDLTGNFDLVNKKYDYALTSENPGYLFNITGTIDHKDSTGINIRNRITLNGTKINIIENYLSGVFKDLSGNATGELEIFGTPQKQFITGQVQIKDSLKMTVKYTNVSYIVNPGIIYFNPDVIEFSNLKIKDTLQNNGLITRGRIYHDGFFKEMRLDIEINSDKIVLINTNRKLSPVFYGYALADTKMKLKGDIDDLKLNVVVNQPEYADITLNTNTQTKTFGKADFIEFKTYGKEMGNIKKTSSSNMTVELLLNATPKAKIKVILDELAGDNIVARGNGNLKIDISASGDVNMNGSYTVEEGNYDFSLQSWFRKPFIIQKGSTINWAGNPYDATINIVAKYLAPKVSLNDLIATANNSSSYSTADLEVTALMTKTLAKPEIKFGINYVNGTQKTDPQIETILELIRKDENVLNKQVAFLVLFDRLLPYSTAVNIGSEGLAVGINTLSDLLAKEATSVINRLLKDAFKTGNIQANIDFRTYSPGGIQASVLERASSNIGLQWNWLDNRTSITITGNFDFGILGNQSTFQLLPNFLLEYKFKLDGTIVGTLFHRQALDALQTDTERNKRLSSGGGIAWRKESDDFWSIFGFRKKKKTG
jgi:hypothetical protein